MLQGPVLPASLRKVLLKLSGIFFNGSLLFKLSDLFFRGYLHFHISVNEGNSFRESCYVTKENALRKRGGRNSDFSFRGPISEIIKKVDFELIVSRSSEETGRVSDFDKLAGE